MSLCEKKPFYSGKKAITEPTTLEAIAITDEEADTIATNDVDDNFV